MGKKELVAAALNPKYETFVIHIASPSVTFLSSNLLNVYPSHRSQIAGLMAKKALIKVSNKDVDFADVFSLGLALKLSKYTGINNHAIELVDGQ